MGSIDIGVFLDERYRIVERRAAGATATVWAADDEFLRRRVAVKILHDHLAADDDYLARFVDEARTAATVNHPALVAVYDTIGDQPGIVLEWINGPDLRQRLDQGPMAPAGVAELGAVLCDGLAALHQQGLIHRDVKPANILLTSDGRPKLTDFGIATANAGDRTATGVILGTAKYLAPEQVRGTALDGRADVFALAAVLYEALAGQAPWVRDGDLPTAMARLEEDAVDLLTLRPELPPALAHTVMRGLARERNDRWPGASAFGDALRGRSNLPSPPTRRLVTHPQSTPVPTQVTRSPMQAPIRARRRRWPRVIGFSALGAIAILGWTLISAFADPDESSPSTTPTDAADVHIVAATAFDPEGSGPDGEHNDRSHLAVDGDPATTWPTERYASRDLGAKTGVGLVLTLDRVAAVSAVTVHTDGTEGWAAEIYVSTGIDAAEAPGIAAFGAARGGGTGLGATAAFLIDATGDTIVVWLTDLGNGAVPIRLAITEVTIR